MAAISSRSLSEMKKSNSIYVKVLMWSCDTHFRAKMSQRLFYTITPEETDGEEKQESISVKIPYCNHTIGNIATKLVSDPKRSLRLEIVSLQLGRIQWRRKVMALWFPNILHVHIYLVKGLKGFYENVLCFKTPYPALDIT